MSYRFGEAEVRPVERQLFMRGNVVAVGSRAFDLLLVLLRHRDRLVTKDELMDQVWPGLVVEEANLPMQVCTLRKLLGTRTIVTIPGRGYRFARPVVHGNSAGPAPSGGVAAYSTGNRRAETARAPGCAPTPLLGRDGDLARLLQMLTLSRLVSVVGPGGVGKTVLAAAAAHALDRAWRDGTAWADLSSITNPALVPVSVAQALRLAIAAGEDTLTPLASALASKEVLVVIDNAEHVVDAVARLASTLLAQAPGVRLLVTSQVPLQAAGGRLLRLGPLKVPAADACPDEALNHGGVAYFIHQCQAADPDFQLDTGNVAVVIAICRQLDGLPLALKLAASKRRLFGLNGLLSRLQTRLKLLIGNEEAGVPVRQRTLAATLEWSHSLLPARDQAVFRRLAVFIGGFTHEPAVSVAGDACRDEWEVFDSLASLVARSLLEVAGDDPPRYRMLESTRHFALHRLQASGEHACARTRHARAVTRLLETADEEVWRQADGPWLSRYAAELGNVRAAIDWCIDNDVDLGTTLAGAAGNFFFLLGLLHELRARIESLEPGPGSSLPASARARYWVACCRCFWGVAHGRMLECAGKAERLYRSLGDERGLGIALYCAVNSGLLPHERAEGVLEELAGMDHCQCPPRLLALVKGAELQLLHSAGRHDELRDSARAMLLRHGAASPGDLDESAFSWIANWIVCAELETGNLEQAVQAARDVAQDRRTLEGRQSMVTFSLSNLTRALLRQGGLAEARQALATLIQRSRTAGWHGFAVFSDLCTLLAVCERRHEAAAMLMGYSDLAWQRIGQGRPTSGARFRARTEAALRRALGAPTLSRLVAAGTRLDEAGACALTLAAEQPGAGDRADTCVAVPANPRERAAMT